MGLTIHIVETQWIDYDDYPQGSAHFRFATADPERVKREQDSYVTAAPGSRREVLRVRTIEVEDIDEIVITCECGRQKSVLCPVCENDE